MNIGELIKILQEFHESTPVFVENKIVVDEFEDEYEARDIPKPYILHGEVFLK